MSDVRRVATAAGVRRYNLPLHTPLDGRTQARLSDVVRRAKNLGATVVPDSRTIAGRNPMTHPRKRIGENRKKFNLRATDIRQGDFFNGKEIRRVQHGQYRTMLTFDDHSETFAKNQSLNIERVTQVVERNKVSSRRNDGKFEDRDGRPLKVGDRIEHMGRVRVIQKINEDGTIRTITETEHSDKNVSNLEIAHPAVDVRQIRRGKPIPMTSGGRNYLPLFQRFVGTEANPDGGFTFKPDFISVEGRKRVGFNGFEWEVQQQNARRQWRTIETGKVGNFSKSQSKQDRISLAAKTAHENFTRITAPDYRPKDSWELADEHNATAFPDKTPDQLSVGKRKLFSPPSDPDPKKVDEALMDRWVKNWIAENPKPSATFMRRVNELDRNSPNSWNVAFWRVAADQNGNRELPKNDREFLTVAPAPKSKPAVVAPKAPSRPKNVVGSYRVSKRNHEAFMEALNTDTSTASRGFDVESGIIVVSNRTQAERTFKRLAKKMPTPAGQAEIGKIISSLR